MALENEIQSYANGKKEIAQYRDTKLMYHELGFFSSMVNVAGFLKANKDYILVGSDISKATLIRIITKVIFTYTLRSSSQFMVS